MTALTHKQDNNTQLTIETTLSRKELETVSVIFNHKATATRFLGRLSVRFPELNEVKVFSGRWPEKPTPVISYYRFNGNSASILIANVSETNQAVISELAGPAAKVQTMSDIFRACDKGL